MWVKSGNLQYTFKIEIFNKGIAQIVAIDESIKPLGYTNDTMACSLELRHNA